MPETIQELAGWQYVNGVRVAVRLTDDGFLISRSASRREIVLGMLALLGKPRTVPVIPTPLVTPNVSGSMTFTSLPYLATALNHEEPGKP